METADEIDTMTNVPQAAEEACIQHGGYLLELSLDWIVRRASENIHHLLGESPVTLIDEPLGKFVNGQALHDLRNLFSKLSGTTGIGRAYAVRLTDDPALADVAFQQVGGRVLLEAAPSADSFGECFGSVGGLVAGLSNLRGPALLSGAARRMRALTGYDRVTLRFGSDQVESARGAFAGAISAEDLPRVICDAGAASVAVFPREPNDACLNAALLKAPSAHAKQNLGACAAKAAMRVPFSSGGMEGEFRCESRTARRPHFELHAASELFAQMFAMQLEIDRLKG